MPRSQSPSLTLPNFVVIGAMRSGTTSLIRYLGEHPEAYISTQKEPHFFDRHWDRGLAWYATHFKGASGHKAVGEGTQSYMYHEDAPARLASVLPEARLVAILRNPVDRAYSQYWHKRARARERLSFPDAIQAELSGARQGDYASRTLYSYLERGRYIDQLRRVCEHFPRQSLLVVLFERLRTDPAGTYSMVCRHLAIDPDFRPSRLGKPVNPYVEFRSPAVRRASRRAPEPVRRLLGRINTKSSSYPPMEPLVRKQLLELFAGPNAELSAWLGDDLVEWSS